MTPEPSRGAVNCGDFSPIFNKAHLYSWSLFRTMINYATMYK